MCFFIFSFLKSSSLKKEKRKGICLSLRIFSVCILKDGLECSKELLAIGFIPVIYDRSSLVSGGKWSTVLCPLWLFLKKHNSILFTCLFTSLSLYLFVLYSFHCNLSLLCPLTHPSLSCCRHPCCSWPCVLFLGCSIPPPSKAVDLHLW